MSTKDTYKALYADIRRKKYFLVFTVLIFLLAVVLGIIAPNHLPLKMTDDFQRLAQELHNETLLPLIARLFLKNAFAVFVAVFSGAIFSIILPIIILFLNGYSIGINLYEAWNTSWRLIPHGVFEYPAIFLACSYGIWLGLWLFNRDRVKTVKHRLKQCIIIYFYILVPLLLVAATIEGAVIKFL